MYKIITKVVNIFRQAFNCWNFLIDHFILDSNNQLLVRRIKVLCIPLNANNTKIEPIAMKKLEVWWHLINFIYKDIAQFAVDVVMPFLSFCFGPLGDTPLMSIKMEMDTPSPGKRFVKTKIAGIDALFQLLVVNRSELIPRSRILEEKLPHCVNQATFAQMYKSFIHSVIEAIYILEHLTGNNFKDRKQAAVTLWNNLMKHVEKATQEIEVRQQI